MDHLPELRHRPLVFVDDLDRPRLRAGDLHHFQRVLRLRPGDPITVGDGAGSWREAEFGEAPVPIGDLRRSEAVAPPITIAFAPVKGTRPEWVVQKLTELGVDRVVPVASERSVVRWDGEKAARQHERMLVAAREACMQSRRVVLPTVERLRPLPTFLAEAPTAAMADPGGSPLAAAHTTIVIGPEGGFSSAELADHELVAVPGGILRAETAALVAATVASGFRAGLFGSGPK